MNWKQPLKVWADDYRKTMLNQHVQDLIRMANYDLHFGPCNGFGPCSDCGEPGETQTEWLGFEKATVEIAAALDDAPRTLWVDTVCDIVSDVRPAETDPCYQCEGLDKDCELCQGHGEINACFEDIVEIDRREILAAIVGKDLAEYVR